MADDVATAHAPSTVTPSWPACTIAQAHALLTQAGSPLEMETLTIRGVETRTWKNAPPTLRAVLELSRAHGPKEVMVYEDERVTYDGFWRATVAFAHELVKAGVKKGDRVAIIARNLPEWPVAFYAAVSLGAVVTPLNAWWTAPELEYGLADSGSKIVIIDFERFERIAEHLGELPALERIYVSRTTEEIAHPR